MKPSASRPMLEGMAAIVPVRDVARPVAFYVDLLGFERREVSSDGSHALVACDHAAIMLMALADEVALAATASNISADIWVSDTDALWEALGSRLQELPPSRFRAPFTQDYGMREFHVKDPDGCLLLFGQQARSGEG